MVTSFQGHLSVVRTLYQAGATVNTTNQNGWTALLYAAEQEHEDVVQLLIEVDADPDLQDKVIYRSPDDYETKQLTANCGCCSCDVTAAM